MNIETTAFGVYMANCEGKDFLLSVQRDTFGIKCVAGYEYGEKKPPISKHKILTPLVRDWLEKIDLKNPFKVHFRFDSRNEVHSRITLFVNGKNSGQLCMSPEEADWLYHVIAKGCVALSPDGIPPFEFVGTGSNIESAQPEAVEL